MRFGPRALAQTTARLGQTQRKGALEGEGGELNLKRSLGALEREKKRKRKRERKKEREREKKKKEKERERERQRNRKRKRKRKRERDKERKRERERSKGPRTVLQTIVVHCFETSAPRLCRTLLVLGQDMTVAEFDNIYVCACAEPYVAERTTVRLFGPGPVLALRVMRTPGRKEVVCVPLVLQLKGRTFHLRASVCHLGDSFESGHYVCHVPVEGGAAVL